MSKSTKSSKETAAVVPAATLASAATELKVGQVYSEDQRKNGIEDLFSKNFGHRYESYNGKGDVEYFINQFKLIELEYNDVQMIALVESCTTGTANSYIRVNKIEGITSWLAMKQKLLERFGTKKLSKGFEYTKMLIEGPGENDIRDYIYSLRILASEIHPEFRDVLLRLSEIVPLGLKDMVSRAANWAELIVICEQNYISINKKNNKKGGYVVGENKKFGKSGLKDKSVKHFGSISQGTNI